MLSEGRRPAVEALVGHEYRGFNRPARTGMLGIRKFTKGFFAAADEAFGFNLRTKQNGIDGDWITRPDDAEPRRYAFFGVSPVEGGSRDDAYPRALLLDYGQGGNPKHDPSRLLRDYLVRVEDDSDELLLGKAYLAVGGARLPVGFFLLERHRSYEVPASLASRVLP